MCQHLNPNGSVEIRRCRGHERDESVNVRCVVSSSTSSSAHRRNADSEYSLQPEHEARLTSSSHTYKRGKQEFPASSRRRNDGLMLISSSSFPYVFPLGPAQAEPLCVVSNSLRLWQSSWPSTGHGPIRTTTAVRVQCFQR